MVEIMERESREVPRRCLSPLYNWTSTMNSGFSPKATVLDTKSGYWAQQRVYPREEKPWIEEDGI
jgi:hypothetical protein